MLFRRCCYEQTLIKKIQCTPIRFFQKSAVNFQSNEQNQRRRVVVTGVGIVSPIGCSVETAWKNVLNKVCGIKKLPAAYDSLPCKIAAKIDENELKLNERFSKSELRSLSLATAYSLIAGIYFRLFLS